MIANARKRGGARPAPQPGTCRARGCHAGMARARTLAGAWAAPLLIVGLATWRLFLPERSLQAGGPRAIADAVFAIGLLVMVLCHARELVLQTLPRVPTG